jgi:two-component system chemotaxis response regulator CheY
MGEDFKQRHSPDSEAKKMTASEPASRRILIVDDDELVATTLHAGLESLPNRFVITETDPREALHRFEQQSIDLLITDYKMPWLDGISLARQVRQSHPQTAIIMITAHDSRLVQRQAGNKMPMRAILDKPVKLLEIRKLALGLLNGSSSGIA